MRAEFALNEKRRTVRPDSYRDHTGLSMTPIARRNNRRRGDGRARDARIGVRADRASSDLVRVPRDFLVERQIRVIVVAIGHGRFPLAFLAPHRGL